MSGFRKSEKSAKPSLPGTIIDSDCSLCFLKTGSEQIDYFIGGGIPIGSIMLIVQDFPTSYYENLIINFIAEGATYKQNTLIASSSNKLSHKISKISKIFDSKLHKKEEIDESNVPKKDREVNALDDRLKIAWRYQYLKENTEDAEIPRCSTLSPAQIQKALHNHPITFLNHDIGSTSSSLLSVITSEISKIVDNFQSCSDDSQKKFTRVVLHDFGSIGWNLSLSSEMKTFSELIAFKSRLRDSPCSALITVSPRAMSSDLMHAVESVSDFVISLKSDVEMSDQNADAFKEFSGIINFQKVTHINRLSPKMLPNRNDLVFSVKNGKFVIQRYHLPPQDMLSSETSKSTTPYCQKMLDPKTKNDYDF